MGCVATTDTVDASALPPQPGAATLSLPARQLKGSAHVGQPVPTYSTVLLALWPHVVSVSVPPSGVVSPRCSAYSRRDPGKNAPSPVAHEPAVYMTGCPDVADDSGGATPDVPDRGCRAGSPRQSGWLGDGERVVVDVRVPDALPVGVRVADALPVGLRVPDALPVGVRVPDALPVDVRVSDALPVPVWLADGVPV